jgi:gamma-glutamyl-gamma-aminobutyrate hydrolase PuuD
MRILIVPKIVEPYKNQIEINVDIKLNNFFEKIFPKSKIFFAIKKDIKKKYDLLILSGGNNLTKFSKKNHDKYRSQLDKFYLNNSIKNNIPVIGICHGAQFIAYKYRSKIIKSDYHLKRHHVFFLGTKKKIIVNSFHNYIIQKKGKMIKIIAESNDKSIECFKIINKKIFGIMWHPERYKKFNKIDINLIKKYICN